MLKKTILIILLTWIGIDVKTTTAQVNTDVQLAAQYFQNQEYEKAVVYYEKLYDNTSTQLYFTPYLNCLTALKDYKKAEKVVRKQVKLYPQQLNYIVELGNIYYKTEESKKASSTWDKAIKLTSNTSQALMVAKAFIGIAQNELAIQAYLKGRRVSENNYPFNFELAKVYANMGKYQQMIDEYLDALKIDKGYLETVKYGLQVSFGNHATTEINSLLKTSLIKRIQKNPSNTIYSELLIWMQLQQNDFEGALIQVKALDKRNEENGYRVINLAQLCVKSKQYATASKAYEYVIKKGKESSFYAEARLENLNVKYLSLITNQNKSTENLLALEEDFVQTIDALTNHPKSLPLRKTLAHLQAFYLNKIDTAIALLQDAIASPHINKHLQAELKLELADIMLMSGEIWEASLLYSQVELKFKHDKIGHEAKFRNAKVSYYAYNFEWAQSQLSVLKGATSKLIANDALNMSLLISDALALDTTTVPLEMFARADLLAFQNKDQEAITVLDSINLNYPNHSLADDILYKKASIALKTNNYDTAALYYQQIIDDYSFGILGDDALFKLAKLYEAHLNEHEKAQALYKQLLEKHTASLYVIEARKRYRELRGDAIN